MLGHMNFFDITECGLYKNQDPNPHGFELREVFTLIQQWVTGKSMEDTLPWDASSSRSGVAKCYLHDIYHDGSSGDYLLVLWKSDTDSSGTVWGAQGSGTVGEAAVIKHTDNYRGKKVIWGRPCYYWVIPSLNVIVSIKFDHSVCDSPLMQDWVAACINNRVNYPKKKKEHTESGYIRFSFVSGSDTLSQRYRFGFNAVLKTVSTSGAELDELAKRVTHIVRRETVKLSSQKDERAAWVKLFDNLPYLAPKPKTERRNIEIRAEAKPTVSEMRKIIQDHAVTNRKKSDWENIGFGTDAGTTTWVDTYRIKNYIDVEDELATGAFSAVRLYEKILGNRSEYLAPVTEVMRKRVASSK